MSRRTLLLALCCWALALGATARQRARGSHRKDPRTAAVLSIVVPGLGHAYAGDVDAGLAVFAGTVRGGWEAARSLGSSRRGAAAAAALGRYIDAVRDARRAALRANVAASATETDRFAPP